MDALIVHKTLNNGVHARLIKLLWKDQHDFL